MAMYWKSLVIMEEHSAEENQCFSALHDNIYFHGLHHLLIRHQSSLTGRVLPSESFHWRWSGPWTLAQELKEWPFGYISR